MELAKKVIIPAIFKFISSDKEHFLGADFDQDYALSYGQRNNMLHFAVKYRESADVEGILRQQPSLAYGTNVKGDTPLHIAARLGKFDVAKMLVESTKESPLEANYPKLLRLPNNKKQTALHEAVQNGHNRVAKLLIEEDPDSTCLINEARESPLFLAVDAEHRETVVHILGAFRHDYGSNFVSGRNGMTAMHAAVIRNQPDLVEQLLSKYGAHILEMADDSGWMPHHYAASMGFNTIIEKILDKTKKQLAYIKDKEGMCALHISARNGQSHVIKTLITTCPGICELLDNKDQTALHIAAKEQQVFAVRTLLNTIAFNDLVNDQDNEGNTALHLACISGHYWIILRLVKDSRTNKRIVNNMGMTAFDIINKSTILSPFDKFMIKRTWGREKDPIASAISWDTKLRKETTISSETKPKSMSTQRQVDPYVEKDRETLKEKDYQIAIDKTIDVNLLVATIIVSITYAAAMQTPGGYDGSNGFATLRRQTSFQSFLVCNSMAFSCSAATMLIHYAVRARLKLRGYEYMRGHEYKYAIPVTWVLTLVSITCTVLAFVMASDAALDKKQTEPRFITAFTSLPGNIGCIFFFIVEAYFVTPLLMAYMKYLYQSAS